MKNLERILKALANKRRLAILSCLKKNKGGGANVSMIAKEIGLSFKSTSRHLQILFGAEIIEKEQRSLNVFYELSTLHNPVVRHLLSIL